MPRATPKQSAPLSRRRGTSESARPLRQNAEELMELAVDAAQSRHLPEFLERFARRAARMLESKWADVIVFRGRQTNLYQATSGEIHPDALQHGALIRSARENRHEIEVRP